MRNPAHNALRLVATDNAAGRPEGIHLPPSPQLDRLIATAAARGLGAPETVRLCLERFFALRDARALGLDPDSARRLLCRQARAPTPRRQLTRREAARVRALALAKPAVPADTIDGLTVPVPDRLLTRFGDRVPARAFRARFVEEMVRWEIAAVFEGRTMGEWALHTLAAAA